MRRQLDLAVPGCSAGGPRASSARTPSAVLNVSRVPSSSNQPGAFGRSALLYRTHARPNTISQPSWLRSHRNGQAKQLGSPANGSRNAVYPLFRATVDGRGRAPQSANRGAGRLSAARHRPRPQTRRGFPRWPRLDVHCWQAPCSIVWRFRSGPRRPHVDRRPRACARRRLYWVIVLAQVCGCRRECFHMADPSADQLRAELTATEAELVRLAKRCRLLEELPSLDAAPTAPSASRQSFAAAARPVLGQDPRIPRSAARTGTRDRDPALPGATRGRAALGQADGDPAVRVAAAQGSGRARKPGPEAAQRHQSEGHVGELDNWTMQVHFVPL